MTATNSTTITLSIATNETPIVSVTSPSNNSYLSVTGVSIVGTAFDPNGASVKINDTGFGTNVGTYELEVTTNASLGKRYSVIITANDTFNASNSTESCSLLIELFPHQ